MKKLFFILSFTGCFFFSVFAQEEVVEEVIEAVTKPGLGKNVEFSLGTAPKSPYSAIKTTISVNNIVLKRIGFYTSVEQGLEKDPDVFHEYNNNTYFTNILGVNITVHRYLYIFGGYDLYTKSGYFHNEGWDKTRKEFGIGITPYKWAVVRLGYSGSVGATATFGAQIPF